MVRQQIVGALRQVHGSSDQYAPCSEQFMCVPCSVFLNYSMYTGVVATGISEDDLLLGLYADKRIIAIWRPRLT